MPAPGLRYSTMPCFRFLCSSRQREDERSHDSASAISSQTAAANGKRSPDASNASHAAAFAAPLHHRFPSLQTESTSSSSPQSAASPAHVAAVKAVDIPSRTLSPSQTTTRLQTSQAASSVIQPWARSRQDSVELVPVSSEPADAAAAGAGTATGRTAEEAKSVSAQSSDAAIKAAFTAPLPTRRLLFPAAPPASIAATIAERGRGDAAAGALSSPSSDESISSDSSSSSSPAPPPAPVTQPPPRPPPHPHTRRLSNTAAPALPAPVATAGAVASRPHSSSMSSSHPLYAPPVFSASQPSTPTSKQPQSLHQTPSPSSGKRTTAPSSTPLRARRLQRHRALSSSSPHSSLFPRASYIAASPTLSAFFSSPAAASMMTQRLMAGGIFLHHEAASSCYRHVFLNSSLTRLHYVELSAASSPSLLSSLPAAAAVKLPHVLCSSIIKLSRGLGTRSLIEKQTAMSESGSGLLLPASQLLSLSTPTVVLDLECCGESERDEWWLTFDWLLWTWNQRRILSQQAGAAGATAGAVQKAGSRAAAGAEARKGSWLGGVVGLFEQQERLLRHDRQKQRRDAVSPTSLLLQSSMPSATAVASRPPADAVIRSGQSRAAAASVAGSAPLSDRELYELLTLYVSDIEQVREANRLLLVEDSVAMIDMQRQIDALRDENVAIIEELRPDSTREGGFQ